MAAMSSSELAAARSSSSRALREQHEMAVTVDEPGKDGTAAEVDRDLALSWY
jgi:hypothetical protein